MEWLSKIPMFEKISISLVASVIIGVIGGRLFVRFVYTIFLKYFQNIDESIKASREELKAFLHDEFRDYKRDIALAIKELYERTDNWEHIKDVIDYCDEKNKEIPKKKKRPKR